MALLRVFMAFNLLGWIAGLAQEQGRWPLHPWGWAWGIAIAGLTLGSLAVGASPMAQPPGSLAPALQATQTFLTAAGTPIGFAALVTALAEVDVVYLGEIHDQPQDHATQLALIQALHRQRPNLAIALEMFQRPYQPQLDAYLAGEITLETLRQQSEYDRRWGYPWEDYAPILAFARQEGLPLIALNAPSEAVGLVARQGLGALNPEDFPTVPTRENWDLDYSPHRDLLQQLYQDIHQGHGAGAGFEFFYQAQVLWDETMAAALADFHGQSPETLLVVLTGQGHIIYGYGIPRRLHRHWPQISQATVLLSPAVHWPTRPEPRADFEGVQP